jgi:hypothetical protein
LASALDAAGIACTAGATEVLRELFAATIGWLAG